MRLINGYSGEGNCTASWDLRVRGQYAHFRGRALLREIAVRRGISHMTEQELDLFMRNVLLDAIALDEETNTETILYTPSLHHQKQIKAMLKTLCVGRGSRAACLEKRALKRVAVILLVISLAFGSLMVVSPTARAIFIRWVTEWNETQGSALEMMFGKDATV